MIGRKLQAVRAELFLEVRLAARRETENHTELLSKDTGQTIETLIFDHNLHKWLLKMDI